MNTRDETFLVGLIGRGVGASLTPAMHEQEARHHGLALVYRPLDLDRMGRVPADVGAILREGMHLGYNAFNITYPCKQVVLSALHEVSPVASRIAAVNTVLIDDARFLGDNTDVSGFAAGLREGLPGVDLSNVVQLGAGGAGAAVGAALLEAGARRLAIVDPDLTRAQETTNRLAVNLPGNVVTAHAPAGLPDVMAAATGLVNTSPVGMHLYPGMPLPADLLRPQVWVADIVYRPLNTELVCAARHLGCRVLDGGHMAVGQAADTFRLVTGREPDRARMREHFLTLVAAEG